MKPRFPVGLTLAVAIALTILIGLGVWQVKRLAWKENLLAHIAALKTAPPVPIGPVLVRLKAEQDVEWTRVSVICTPRPPRREPLRYALRDGKIVWRAESFCFLPQDANYSGVMIDRGYVEDTEGRMDVTSTWAPLPSPASVVGVLRRIPVHVAESGVIAFEGKGPAPIVLIAEHEDPAPPGITPSGLPEKISNNHLSYALTWFGLAGALLAVYAAMLFRRLRPAA
jgi:surfeit locus 1 family protein